MNAGRIKQYIDPKITVGNILTIIGIFVGGVWYMAQNDARIERLDVRLVAVERSILEAAVSSNMKDDRTNSKFEAITAKLNTVDVTTARTDERVAYLIRELQNTLRSPSRGPQ